MKSLQDILNGITSDRHARIEARTEALRQALIEGEENGEDSPLDMEGSGAKHGKKRACSDPLPFRISPAKELSLHNKYDIFILMSNIERITITLTAEMAHSVRAAVQAGEYASSSEIIREALRDWRHKRALQDQELRELRAKVRQGLDDIEAGRVHDFDPERIIRKGEQQSQNPESSA